VDGIARDLVAHETLDDAQLAAHLAAVRAAPRNGGHAAP